MEPLEEFELRGDIYDGITRRCNISNFIVFCVEIPIVAMQIIFDITNKIWNYCEYGSRVNWFCVLLVSLCFYYTCIHVPIRNKKDFKRLKDL